MKKLFWSLFILLTIPSMCCAFNSPQFYRANHFFGETRLEKAWLTSFDIAVGHGKTDVGRDDRGNKVPFLNIYGLQDLQHLGEGVPNKDVTCPGDLTITLVSRLPKRDCFGKVSFCGNFSITEANFWFAQNFSRGFFFEAHIPVRSIKIKNPAFFDVSPQDDICPNANTPLWKSLLNQLCPILKKHCLFFKDVDKTGAGDLVLQLGWTQNFHEMPDIDFVDTTFRFGVLVPTSDDRDENSVFDLPVGYNGHFGLPMQVDFAVGVYDWFNLGAHMSTLFFFDKTKCIRMKTSRNQQGFIKLAKGEAEVDRGTLWQAGVYAKADHVVRGFSLLFGYSFVKQNKTKLTPTCNSIDCFCPTIVNCDEMLQSWKMHTLHFALEYDFTKENHFFGPRIGFFYNTQVGGKRVFKTNMYGGTFGLDLSWQY